MTKPEILEEQTRLRVYRLDLEKNLPQLILEHDYGYKLASERLNELSKMLEDEEKAEAARSEQEKIEIVESETLLNEIIKRTKQVVSDLEQDFQKLHPLHKARGFEVLTELKKITR